MARHSHPSVVQQPFASGLAALIAALVLLSVHPLDMHWFAGASSPDLAAPREDTSDECLPLTSRDELASPNQPPYPQDVVLMIDSSGSMGWNDPSGCRLAAAKFYLDQLSYPDRVSVLDFDSFCIWTGPDHHLNSTGHDGIPDYSDPKADVDQIDSQGGTNLLCPTVYASAELTGLGSSNHTWIGILLTDGYDIVGNTWSDIIGAATNASNAGITIYTIGFGDADTTLLQAIANATGGRYFDGSNCTLMRMAYDSIYKIVVGGGDEAPMAPRLLDARVIGTDVQLTWELSPDDGGGENDVTEYQVWHGTTYDAAGTSYNAIATIPAGEMTYAHIGAGGDNASHFYTIWAVDAAGHWTPTVDQAAKLSQYLSAGMQLISVPLIQSDWDVEAVLTSVSWSRAYAHDDGRWLARDSDGLSSSLTTMDTRWAYWVDMEAANWWTVAGLVPDITQVTLRRGWNLVGYPSLSQLSVSQVLSGVDYLTVEGYAEDSPYHLRSLAAADTMSAGNGYWIQVARDAVLTFTN